MKPYTRIQPILKKLGIEVIEGDKRDDRYYGYPPGDAQCSVRDATVRLIDLKCADVDILHEVAHLAATRSSRLKGAEEDVGDLTEDDGVLQFELKFWEHLGCSFYSAVRKLRKHGYDMNHPEEFFAPGALDWQVEHGLFTEDMEKIKWRALRKHIHRFHT